MADKVFRRIGTPVPGSSALWFSTSLAGGILRDEFFGIEALPPSSGVITYTGPSIHGIDEFGPTYSFNTDIGAASADRLVVVGFACENFYGTVTSATIAGVTATILGSYIGADHNCVWLAATVPSGTGLQTVSITGSVGWAYSASAVWIVRGAQLPILDGDSFADPTFPYASDLTMTVAAGSLVLGEVVTFSASTADFSGMSPVPNRTSALTTTRYRNFLDVIIPSGTSYVISTPGNQNYFSSAIVLQPVTVANTNGYIKVWSGTEWVDKPVKYWTGTEWVTKPVKYWNGSAWIITGTGYNPSVLFSAGEVGGVFDISNISTLFQDSTGNVPVTAAGQQVGFVMDVSNGIPTLGAEIISNGDFSAGATGWGGRGDTSGITFTGGTMNFSAVGGGSGYEQTFATRPAGWYRISFTVSGASGGGLYFRLRTSGAIFVQYATENTAVNGVYTGLFFSPGNFDRVEIISPGGAGSPTTLSIDDVSLRFLPGRHAYQDTPSKRPIYQLDASSPYLGFDGADDCLVVPGINLSTVDTATVIAGVRTTFSADGIICEYGATYNSDPGSFALFHFVNGRYFAGSGGTIPGSGVDSAVFTSPSKNLVSGVFDISTDKNLLRVDKVDYAGAADKGAGTFGNYNLFIGQRNNTSLAGNIRLYGFIIRGADTTGVSLTNAEDWITTRMGLPPF